MLGLGLGLGLGLELDGDRLEKIEPSERLYENQA